MKVIIAGSRNITNMRFVEEAIYGWNDPIAYPNPETRPQITEVVCGEARGVDTLGKQWAIKNNIPVKSFPADWDKYGKAAGYVRNEQMSDYADSLIVVMYIEDEHKMVGTRGTTHMLNIAKEKGLRYYIRYVYKEDL
jgi:hypothetical protein